MMEEHPLTLKILTWTAIIVAAISMFATPALTQELAQEFAPASAKPAFKACLQSNGTQCMLIADSVGISIGVAQGDAEISYLIPAVGGWKIDRRESVNKDMEAQVLAGNISDDDAAFAFAELLSSHDLAYKIPENVNSLKTAVGFSPQAVLTPQDQVDVIAAHLQMSLGVSAVTADYLVMKLGLEINDTQDAAIEQASTEADDPNLTSSRN